MRMISRYGIAVVALATSAVACADRQQTRPASSPTPQAAFSDPKVQKPYDPIASNPTPQQPIDNPTPQQSTFPSHGPQQPISDPVPQPPLQAPSDESAKAPTDRPLSDAEVIGVAIAANQGEVQLAEIALKRATTPDVKQFAGKMKTGHQEALQKDKALQKKTKITAAESDVASSLKSDVADATKDLRTKTGKDFDRAYVESQAKAHKDVLILIDNRLLPSATNGELKASLSEMRRHVADHLVKVENLQKKLEAGPPAKAKAKSTEPLKQR